MKFITRSGKQIDLLRIKPKDIEIEDIAASLSKQCRFGGHTKRFYSVAEHSLLVSMHVRSELRLKALLHDASEAYIVDLPAPLKELLPDYYEIESNVQSAIAEKFKLYGASLSSEIKEADLRALRTEFEQLFHVWKVPPDLTKYPAFEIDWQLGMLSCGELENGFLRVFRQLTTRN